MGDKKGDRIINSRKIPILNKKGEVELILGIADDITRKKMIEQQLFQTEHMASLGEMAAAMAP